MWTYQIWERWDLGFIIAALFAVTGIGAILVWNFGGGQQRWDYRAAASPPLID